LETLIGSPAQVAGGQPQADGHAGVGEAEVDDGVEAEVSHHVLGPAAERLLATQPSALPDRLGERRRQVLVVAVDPPHLLDQVRPPG